jgi:hypothetical protein
MIFIIIERFRVVIENVLESYGWLAVDVRKGDRDQSTETAYMCVFHQAKVFKLR